ncbi:MULTISPECIES: aldo/keto reductase [Streptomyces]|uniref:Aldo/keto reductase n=1 Tax=Streptomyces cyaneofuscatus TaxID=66883 RepID=A0ABZ1F0S5_9ACTN|nr:aldo/keto reductase [Streptomyces cyaneofuscatus]WSB10001.1 aldo/keto reductase [Streptomyces cyaneofuscatus]WSD46466.1 aldo/keto reductase [Streptomyces cyaneofuscatus]
MLTKLPTTSMGGTGLTVPLQGLGCMRMTESAAAAGRDEASTIVNHALDLGATMIDTSDMYGRGRNEEMVGQALGRRRGEAVLCTRFGVVFTPDGGWRMRGDAAFVRSSCEASLRRLGTDVIDLYYLARPHVDVPLEETVGAMAELVTEGKVRHLGLSEVSGDELRRAHAVAPISAVQSEWSLGARRIESMVHVCAELGVGVVPFSPNGRGLLSGRPDTTAQFAQTFPGREGLPAALREIAAGHGVRPGQIALAWVHHRARVWGTPVVPIPGTRRVPHLEENVAAASILLGADELNRLDAASLPPA